MTDLRRMTRDDLLELLLVERFQPIPPPLARPPASPRQRLRLVTVEAWESQRPAYGTPRRKAG